MRKRKKKIWTTKNTHIKRNAKKDYVEPETWYDKLETWIIIAIAILIILVIALDNHIRIILVDFIVLVAYSLGLVIGGYL